MKKLSLIVVFNFFAALCIAQTSEKSEALTWHTNVNDAQALAKQTNKPIMAFFTGSDWCGWCHKLQREVFAKPAFVEWANDNVVLLELDFPRNKQLPVETVQQNQALQQFFKVSGFPTIWMFNLTEDPANKRMLVSALGSLGYPGGAIAGKEEDKFLAEANQILAKNVKK